MLASFVSAVRMLAIVVDERLGSRVASLFALIIHQIASPFLVLVKRHDDRDKVAVNVHYARNG